MLQIPGFYDRENYEGADLRQANLQGRHFKMCSFRGANLRGANLRGSSFAGCDLRNADLRDTDLTYARFGRVLTHDPNYGLTDVSGVLWDGARIKHVQVSDVVGWPEDLPTE